MSGTTQAMCAVAMIQAHGSGPDGVECSQCKWLKALPRIDRPQGSLFECTAWDYGARSRFHRSSWPACWLFEQSKTGRAIPKPSQLIDIECPGCGAQRSYNRNYVEAHPGLAIKSPFPAPTGPGPITKHRLNNISRSTYVNARFDTP